MGYGKMITNDDSEYKEYAVVCFKILFHKSSGGTEKKQRICVTTVSLQVGFELGSRELPLSQPTGTNMCDAVYEPEASLA
jgi:hypothetical protein